MVSLVVAISPYKPRPLSVTPTFNPVAVVGVASPHPLQVIHQIYKTLEILAKVQAHLAILQVDRHHEMFHQEERSSQIFLRIISPLIPRRLIIQKHFCLIRKRRRVVVGIGPWALPPLLVQLIVIIIVMKGIQLEHFPQLRTLMDLHWWRLMVALMRRKS